jgi:hypothetical protein
VPEKDYDCKNCGERDPGDTPKHGLAKFDGVGAAMEHTQVQHQHGEDEEIK